MASQQRPDMMKLTDDVVDSIRRYKRANPRATYDEMGRKFDLSKPSIMRALHAATPYRRPTMKAPAPIKVGPMPQPAGSCIRPIPLSRLMAGR